MGLFVVVGAVVVVVVASTLEFKKGWKAVLFKFQEPNPWEFLLFLIFGWEIIAEAAIADEPDEPVEVDVDVDEDKEVGNA